jgi:hypothetical protein
VKGSIYIHVAKLTDWIAANSDSAGGLNIDVMESKSGNVYCQLNTYQKGQASAPKEELPTIEYPDEEISAEDLPF